jgi:K(+)-stimulated pyrophosphate-energized sodium pump
MYLGTLFAGLCGLIALGYGLTWMRWVLAKPPGNARMEQIAKAIRGGGFRFLHRQYLIIAVVGLVLTATLWQWLGVEIGVGFLTGAVLSGLSGYIGLITSTRANLRTAEAARQGGIDAALQVAFRGGAVPSLLVVGLALSGLCALYLLLAPDDPADHAGQMLALQALVGFAFGGSLISIFARLGSGLFTKGADIGAEIIAQIGAGDASMARMLETATLTDSVGDSVGGSAGMAADLFETYAVTLIAAMLLGALLFGEQAADAIVYPLLLAGAAILATVLAVGFVRPEPGDARILVTLSKGFAVSAVLAFALFVPVTWIVLPATFSIEATGEVLSRWGVMAAAAAGLVMTGLMLVITEYYTSTDYAPARGIAKASSTGHASNLIAGLAISMKSTAAPILMICATIWVSYASAGVYGIAIAATSMASMTGIILALDGFGTIADTADGIAAMAHMDESVRSTTAHLDAVGNTTKAVSKGYAVASAGLAALVLFSDFSLSLAADGQRLGFGLDSPPVLIGLLIGALMPYLFSAMALESIGRIASAVIEEAHRRLRETSSAANADAGAGAPFATEMLIRRALRDMVIPSLLPVAVPLAVGFGMQWLMGGDAGALALGGLLIGTIITGLFVALSMTAGGGAWDNAKKYIEAGHFGGHDSQAHRAAVTGDLVGDPSKDAAGPAINPLIKIINLVALLMVPWL